MFPRPARVRPRARGYTQPLLQLLAEIFIQGCENTRPDLVRLPKVPFAPGNQKMTHSCRGRIHYSEMYEMLKNMDPPLGFGSKCPDRLAYKKLIRMNMPLDNEGKVHFNTTLFALIRENLNIKMRSAEEMDQADIELRETILKVWPFTAKDKIEVLVPTTRGESRLAFSG